MNKIFIALLMGFLMVLQAAAQKATRQYPGKVKYQKTEQDATVFDVPYPAPQVEDGLKEMFNKKGVKVKEKNGFYEAKNVPMHQLGNKNGEVYYKVVKDGKNECKLYVILTEPGEDLQARTSSHTALAAGAALGTGAILGDIAPALDEHDFNVVKTSQEENIKKTERKLTELQDEQSKLQKRLADINKELDKNAQDQQKTNADLEAKKSGLAELMKKRGDGKVGKKD